MVSKDRKALKELKDLRNIDTNDSIRQELENIVNSYEDLREQFQR